MLKNPKSEIRKPKEITIVFFRFSDFGFRIYPASRRILAAHLVEELLAIGSHVPGIGPEAQVDAPPVVRHPALVERRQQLVEVELTGAERIVRARVVLVERAIGIDQMDVRYPALEL